MGLHTLVRVVLCTAIAVVVSSAAFAATPVGQVCQDIAPENLAADEADAPVAALELAPTDGAVSASTCTYYGTEWCIDTHETTPCWTIRFSQPHCPTTSGICVTNIQYHTYDLYSCS